MSPGRTSSTNPGCGRTADSFTLVELLVAVSITTLMLLGMTGIFDQSMKAWQIASRKSDAEREVRSALSILQSDLLGLVVNSNLPIYYNTSRLANPNNVNVANSGFQLTLANHPPKSGPIGQNWSNTSIVLFFASIQPAGSPDAGDVAGIGYFITWDATANGGQGGWNLYRRYQSPTDLRQGLQAKIITPASCPYSVNNLAQPEIIGANCLNFYAQLVNIASGAAGLPQNMVSDAQFQTGTTITTRPRYIQLELTAYGGDQVRSFLNQADWSNTNNLRRFARSYVWRVDL